MANMSHHRPNPYDSLLSRRQLLTKCGMGMGALALGTILSEAGYGNTSGISGTSPLRPHGPQYFGKAKRVIHLFMNGGPSQVDTFDPKPALAKYHGQRPPASTLRPERPPAGLMRSPYRFDKCGQSGLEVSEIFPHLARCADDLCVIRSMHT